MPKKIIICTHGFSKDVYKVGSHHYAHQLSKLGYEVLVISTPISIFHFINLFKSAFRKRFALKLSSSLKGIYKTDYLYKEFIPFSIFPYAIGKFINRNYTLKKQNNLIPIFHHQLQKHKFNSVDFLIVENPVFSFMANSIAYKKLFYRATDIYPEFSTERTSIFEKAIVQKADTVIVTSTALKNYLEKSRVGQSAIRVIENGVDSDFYLSEDPSELKRKELNDKLSEKSLQIVYVGAIDNRIDYEIIKQITSRFPNYNFHFFGTVSNSKFYSAIGNKTNCFFWGPIEYKFLPQVLKKCHVGLLPFIRNEINDSRSPMKLYEYGICGLTVIATRTIDLEKKNEPFVILCERSEFITALSNAELAEKPNKSQAIKKSKLHSWKSNSLLLIKIMEHA
ncbi:glycosyltransferase [Sunxiuqinia indica]|uniref:glycosyltransferase n=1 Tax=Sunxiuqinia indica TaxID=2692584 RepID=UPI00135721C3|nr:glycosyltransferase [Sunxiuqinia indica]